MAAVARASGVLDHRGDSPWRSAWTFLRGPLGPILRDQSGATWTCSISCCCPGPLEVHGKNSRSSGGTHDSLFREERIFKYTRASAKPEKLKRLLRGLIVDARKKVRQLHALVMPELALTKVESDVLERQEAVVDGEARRRDRYSSTEMPY